MPELDRKDLKIQALLERISQITANYENQAADYRVEITGIAQRAQEAETKVAEFEAQQEASVPELAEPQDVPVVEEPSAPKRTRKPAK